MKRHPLIKSINKVLLSKGFQGGYILELSQFSHATRLILELPEHKETNELDEVLTNLQEELQANDHKIEKQEGKRISILFGKRPLEPIPFTSDHLTPNTLKIKLPSSFGYKSLDFMDGASCHLLNGGTTRMGKTSLLLYISTLLYIQNEGDIGLHITSTKLKDYYPFKNLPNVHLSRSETDLSNTLDSLIQEYKVRDNHLYSETLPKATDAKSVLETYPNQYHLFKPFFLIIDEYARFSENREIQNKIMELVETAGYVNIHIIISSQRPDARTVLPPRIKANLLARICFTTADRNNSIVILDREGAENLGNIQGRALFLDSTLTTVQVPYLSTERSYELLNPYRKEVIQDDNQIETGSTNTELSRKVQDMFKKSISEINFYE